MKKSLGTILFTFLFLLFICSFSYNNYAASATEQFLEERIKVSIADLPREEIALFFQRLASGVGTTKQYRFGVDQRSEANNLINRKTSEDAKIEKRRKIIVRPLVNAVLHRSASSTIPNTRISILNTPTSTVKTTTISNKEEKNIGELKNIKSLQKYENNENISKKSTLEKMSWIVAVVIIGLFFSLATTIGNALVMLSICVDRKLQTISNYFLFSLAVADLTIGLISIPLMALYTANETWTFGYSLCQFWLCIDYLMCNASALNLLLISFDRYFSVTRPLTYRPKRTTRKALIMIACTYIISLLLWPPWIVLWPYLENRFIVEESSLCVVQFLVLGDERNLVNQLATLFTSAAAFYIPVTLMIILYYKVYLETRRRRKELRKLQAGGGQQLFAPSSKLATTPALQSLLLPLAPLIRGLQPPPTPPPPTLLSENSTNTAIFNLNKNKNNSFIKLNENSKINFIDILMGNKSTNNIYNTNNSIKKKRERFSLLKFCTGRNLTTQSSSECFSTEDSVEVVEGDDNNNTNIGGEEEEEETYGGLTTSNLDSILAEQTAIELANNSSVDGGEFRKEENWESIIVAKAKERREALIEEEKNKNKFLQFQYLNKESSTSFRSVGSGMPIVELERTSRPSSVHTYNSIVIIEYPEGNGGVNGKDGITSQRPSVRLSSHAEVESLSARNSVERRFIFPSSIEQNLPLKEEIVDSKNQKTEQILKESPSSNSLERQRLRLSKSAPGGGSIRSINFSAPQQNGVLMRKSEIQMLREEQMRQSEKEKRRNERKQESKAAKTLSAILCAFIITCTPYHVIVCLEAFYPNSVPISLFTISYFLSYINSTINPLCYALCNARFRMTYMKIIRCKWWGNRRRQSSGINTQAAAFLHHHRQMRSSGKRALLTGRHRTR